MALSVFDAKEHPPQESELQAALGRSYMLWTDLLVWLDESFEPVTRTWQFNGLKWGWSLKIQRRKRAIVYLTPCKKHFLAGFALGEKAVAAAFEAGLPEEVRQLVNDAPRYGEGRGVRLPVRNRTRNAAVKTLASAKMST